MKTAETFSFVTTHQGQALLLLLHVELTPLAQFHSAPSHLQTAHPECIVEMTCSSSWQPGLTCPYNIVELEPHILHLQTLSAESVYPTESDPLPKYSNRQPCRS